MYFPWDMDFTFTNGATSGVTPSSDLNKLIGIGPKYERAYYGHLLDIIETAFNSDYMTPWLRHYSDFFPSENLNGYASYIRSRSNHVKNLINNAVSKVSFKVTSNAGTNTNDSTVSVRGDAWVDVREIRLAGSSEALDVEWVDDNSWQVKLPVLSGSNDYTLQGIGFSGELVGSASYSVNGNGSIESAGPENLAISEVHYHPLSPNDEEINGGFPDASMFEWIELVNLSDSKTLDLSDVRFVNGINFTIPFGTTLAPDSRMVLASNAAAFTKRYGELQNGVLLNRSFIQNDGTNKLSNAGERITLYNSANFIISDFSYKDDRPWPVSADTSGYSLTLMMPEINDPSEAKSWRTSLDVGGSPGTSDFIPISSWVDKNGGIKLLEDNDGDGRLSIIEYLENTDPLVRDNSSVSVELDGGGELRLEFIQAIGHDQVYFSVQQSNNLKQWDSEEVEYRGRINNGDGTETVRFQINDSIKLLGRSQLLRLLVKEEPWND
jgi:hypothetical protein